MRSYSSAAATAAAPSGTKRICVYRNIMKDYVTLRCRTTVFSVWIPMNFFFSSLYQKSICQFFFSFSLLFFWFLFLFAVMWRETEIERKNHALDLMHSIMQIGKESAILFLFSFFFKFLFFLSGLVSLYHNDEKCFRLQRAIFSFLVMVVVVGGKQYGFLLTKHFFTLPIYSVVAPNCDFVLIRSMHFCFWFGQNNMKSCQFSTAVGSLQCVIKWIYSESANIYTIL